MNSMASNQDKKRKSPLDLNTIVYGKIPPQAKDLEEAVLGAIMLEIDAFDTVNSLLKDEMFYIEAHQRIYRAMCALAASGRPIDLFMVPEQLKNTGELELVGGPYYLTKLTNSVVSAANITHHCNIILGKWIQRRTIQMCGDLISLAYEDLADPFELFEEADKAISEITNSLSFGDMVDISQVLVEAIQKIEELRAKPDDQKGVTGVPFGFLPIDRLTRGGQPGDLIYFGARPSVGKTAFALSVVVSAAEHFKRRNKGESVAVWSLEMKPVRLAFRLIANLSEVWLSRIQTGLLSEEQMQSIYENAIQVLAELKVVFDGNPGLTMTKLRAKARKLKKTKNLGLIVIDYLQLMTGEEKPGRNREQEISTISRGLKNLAQELNVPIIALSQLSRESEKTGRPPELNAFRESGSLEQDADVVFFIYNPTDAEIAENASMSDVKYIKIAKNRDGNLDTIKLRFNGAIQQFEVVDDNEFRPPSRFVPVRDPSEGEKLFIQIGSKLSNQDDDDPF
jgi:replicative DNA helicase